MAAPGPISEAAQYDLTVMKGSNFKQTFTLKDSGGTAFDLTSVTAAAQIRDAFSSSSANLIATFSAAVVTATAGTVSIALANSITGALTGDGGTTRDNAERWVWDLELTYADGSVYRWLEGAVTLSQEATF